VANAIATQYGVGIQVNGPDPTKGVRAISTEAEAKQIITILPPTTPWAAIPSGWSHTTYQVLARYFGKPQTLDKAFGVVTVGIAWRPDKMPVNR
jgi:hypothetical protein